MAEKAGGQLKGAHHPLSGAVWHHPHVSVHPDDFKLGEADPDR